MVAPVSGNIKWTSSFDEPRPLTAKVKTHVHGAEDITSSNSTIVAPESGDLYFFCAIRPDRTRGLKELTDLHSPFDFKGKSYFYDVFGGVIILVSTDKKRTHIMTHSYRNQMFNINGIFPSTDESPIDERFPICVEHTFNKPKSVREGEPICHIGNAGFSTGRHVHWEIHNGTSWNDYDKRIKPKEWLAGDVHLEV